MKNEEENTKETWQKPEICDLDIKRTAAKDGFPDEIDSVMGPTS